MSGRLVTWSALRIGRRRVAQAALSRLFGLLARVAVGRIRAEGSNTCPCSGPFNGGYCGSSLCSGSSCSHSGITTCSLTIAYCGTGGCWSCSGQTCCDCVCNGGGSTWYCYCKG
jgi:hypothetical protein